MVADLVRSSFGTQNVYATRTSPITIGVEGEVYGAFLDLLVRYGDPNSYTLQVSLPQPCSSLLFD